VLAAGIAFAVTQFLFAPIAPFVTLPFLGIAAWLAWREFRTAAPLDVPERLKSLRDMSWENFSLVVSEAYRRQGYTVEPSRTAGFDLLLRKDNRATLVQCRRWRVSQAGEGPLRELNEAVSREDAFNAVAISAGAFSPKAHAYAAGTPIALVSGAELVKLVGRVGKRRRRWRP
jgi:restriction system protein